MRSLDAQKKKRGTAAPRAKPKIPSEMKGKVQSPPDAAMYAAKTQERNTFRFYTPLMHADARMRLMLGADLRQALIRD